MISGAFFIIIQFGYHPWVPNIWVPNPHGYPRVIPQKTQNFELYGYPTRKYPWNSDTNPTQPIPKIWFGSGYYPWVPEFWVPNPQALKGEGDWVKSRLSFKNFSTLKLLFSSKLSHVTHSQHKNSKHMVSGDLKPPLGMTFQFCSWIQSGKLQLSISLRTFVKDIALNPLSKFSSLLIPLQSLPKPYATVHISR